MIEKAEHLLEFVGLYSKRKLVAGSLSFGQQKLLEFAMALMNEPKVLLLDEPTAGINPTLINGLIDRLKRANRDFGITLFVIEHNMRVIMNLAEHIYCMSHRRGARLRYARRDPRRPARDRRLPRGERVSVEAAPKTAGNARRVSGYHDGDVDVVLSVDEVARKAEALRTEIPEDRLLALAGGAPFLSVAGCAPATATWRSCTTSRCTSARGQSLCLIGPNGAGKSTVLHSVYGFTRIFDGEILDRRRAPTGATSRGSPPSASSRTRDSRLHPPGQVRLPRHDRRGEPADGRLPAALQGAGARPRRSACSTSTSASPPGASIRRACSPAASGACSRSRARW